MSIRANDLTILMSDSPGESPTYREPEYRLANLSAARVVGRGMANGLATVDFIFEDEHGQKYVALLTGSLVDALAGAVRGMNERVATQNKGGH